MDLEEEKESEFINHDFIMFTFATKSLSIVGYAKSRLLLISVAEVLFGELIINNNIVALALSCRSQF